MRLRRTSRAVIAGQLATAGLVGVAVTPAAAIVGGSAAEAPDAGIGSLQVEANGVPDWGFCSAHLVGNGRAGETDLALTNAHCVTDPPPEAQVEVQGPIAQVTTQAGYFRTLAVPLREAAAGTTPYTFVVGSADRFAREHVGVAAVAASERWAWGTPDPGVVDPKTKGWIWDIAVLKLAHPVHYRGALIAPVLPWLSERALGWGMTNPDPATWGHHPLGAQLHRNDVPVVPAQQCADAGIGKAEVCLGVARDGGGACAGDSGGGGLQRWGTRWVLTATTSRGPQLYCCTVNVYTQVWPYRAWLGQTARLLHSSARIDVASVDAVRAQAAADHVSDSQLTYALAG
ncbi:trypsin-like serine protease [Amycolatopsis mediterranei]|uniref:S1 family peptidase n=1 Tax=Amycolatopsis mediterranei TaxID=33910 RepID=UPI0034161CBE